MSARAPQQPSDGHLLTFDVGGSVYALPISCVLEVAEVDGVACIPTLPPQVGGVVNHHGDALPVVLRSPLLALDEEKRDAEKDFKTVSRKHARISCYDADNVEVEDLSSNGTFVDGERIDRIVITDLGERSHELLLGTRERLRLEWRQQD